jgi:catechol 2,3-dioxygenase-like lactoylglutathione lyase family enzyme
MAGIDRIVSITVGVKDQDEALRWYAEKLGFEKRTDMTGQGMRWLTVSPKKQPELEVVCQKTYEELKERGVSFSQLPQSKPYGFEAVFKDLYGNSYALMQRGKAQ